MYGDTDGKPLTEDLPYAATTRKGQVRAAMSEAALAAHQAGKVPVALGRGSDFFGPWALDSALGDRVFYPALAGKAASFGGKLDLPHTATYIGDFGRAAGDLGRAGRGVGPGLARAQRPAADHPAPVRRAALPRDRPPGQGQRREQADDAMAGLFIPGARETVEMMYEFEKPFVVDSSKFERAFGVTATPMADAIKATVAWYRAHPKG